MSARPPLVAVLTHVPLVSEGVAAALKEFAEVRLFPSDGDTPGLLRSVKPDAIVVDNEEQAEAAMPFARETNAPLLHISLRDQRLLVFRRGGWREDSEGGATSEAIRNAIAGGLYGGRKP